MGFLRPLVLAGCAWVLLLRATLFVLAEADPGGVEQELYLYPYRLLDFATLTKRSHSMQSMLRLPAAYGYYAACGTPAAVYGFSDHAQSRFQRLVGKSTSQSGGPEGAESAGGESRMNSQSSCDSGKTVCRGFTCDFLIQAGVPCAHLVTVWGCQGCLECSSCWGKTSPSSQELNVLSKDKTGLTLEGSQPYVCPRCSDLQPPAHDQKSSVAAEYCDGLAGAFQSCLEANQAGQTMFPQSSDWSSALASSPTVAMLVDDPPADSLSEMCPIPSSLSGLDFSSVFPLIVFELPIESAVGFLSKLPTAPDTSRSQSDYAVSSLRASWVDKEKYLHRAADHLIRTYGGVAVAAEQIILQRSGLADLEKREADARQSGKWAYADAVAEIRERILGLPGDGPALVVALSELVLQKGAERKAQARERKKAEAEEEAKLAGESGSDGDHTRRLAGKAPQRSSATNSKQRGAPDPKNFFDLNVMQADAKNAGLSIGEAGTTIAKRITSGIATNIPYAIPYSTLNRWGTLGFSRQLNQVNKRKKAGTTKHRDRKCYQASQLANMQEEQEKLYYTATELHSRSGDSGPHRALGDGSLVAVQPWKAFINDGHEPIENGTIPVERRFLKTLTVSIDPQVTACDSDSDCDSLFYCTIMHECRRRDCLCIAEADKFDEGMPLHPWWLGTGANATRLLRGNEESRNADTLVERPKLTVSPPCRGVVPVQAPNQISWEAHTATAKAVRQLSIVEKRQRLFWFHCPKCGTSFYNTLYHWMCPTMSQVVKLHPRGTITEYHNMFPNWAFCDIFSRATAGHLNYNPGLDEGIAMGNFRSPRSRILSGFNANFHHYGMASKVVPKFKQALDAALEEGGSVAGLKTYAEWPDIPHCQTKMLLGTACAHRRTLNQSDVDQAVLHIRRGFAFVGITDRYHESICLFHAMFGGPLLHLETFNTRPHTHDLTSGSDTENAAFLHVNANAAGGWRRATSTRGRGDNMVIPEHYKLTDHYNTSLLDDIGFSDWADEQIFAEVEAKFERQMKQFGQDVPACVERLAQTAAARE